ncbi:acetophenone carboxylase [Quadrisphaera granulorum]|uniref:Acetophenone carboxylase n=1 Tax=Quadrisphaera granulorum TaxID=317664 RepID=A0A316AAF4_9ACTN|nr:acetone carboxylase subunit gamma [Quadrisphaera granulorum]PWJ54379.1 acetophenone carboxylase [Quadrisphaera granulorum]SZE96151.1 acetophenone carboxylase [Quadrisphaera granulorum]
MKIQITENLDVDVEARQWCCHHCGTSLGSADTNYKQGCLVAAREPDEVWQPHVDEQVTFSYHRDWCRLVEFYCPGCQWLVEVEVLPPGHPITHDIELDLDQLTGPVEGAR